MRFFAKLDSVKPLLSTRGLCNVGDYYDDEGDSGGSGSSIWATLIESGTSIADTVLTQKQPNVVSPYGATGVNALNPQTGLPYGVSKQTTGTSYVVLIALAFVGFFIFSKMKA